MLSTVIETDISHEIKFGSILNLSPPISSRIELATLCCFFKDILIFKTSWRHVDVKASLIIGNDGSFNTLFRSIIEKTSNKSPVLLALFCVSGILCGGWIPTTTDHWYGMRCHIMTPSWKSKKRIAVLLEIVSNHTYKMDYSSMDQYDSVTICKYKCVIRSSLNGAVKLNCVIFKQLYSYARYTYKLQE